MRVATSHGEVFANFLRHEQSKQVPTLCLLPGGPGFSHRYLKDELLPLKSSCNLLFFDPIGTGISDPGDQAHWTVDESAIEVLDVLDHFKLDHVYFLAHSAGTLTLRTLLAKAPKRVRGSLYSSPAIAQVLPGIAEILRTRGDEQAADIAKRLWKYGDFDCVADYFEHVFEHYETVPLPDSFVQRIEFNLDKFIALFPALMDDSEHTPLFRPGIPGALLLGKEDPLAPPIAVQEALGAQLKDVRVHCFEKSGHNMYLSETDAAVLAVKEFIEDCEAEYALKNKSDT